MMTGRTDSSAPAESVALILGQNSANPFGGKADL